jgi:hypothetical protein
LSSDRWADALVVDRERGFGAVVGLHLGQVRDGLAELVGEDERREVLARHGAALVRAFSEWLAVKFGLDPTLEPDPLLVRDMRALFEEHVPPTKGTR